MQQLSSLLHDLIVHLGYAGLFLVMALGNLGIPVGTEVVMPTAGALAGQGHLPALAGVPAWIWVGLFGTLGEIAGGSLLYAIGWFGGIAFVQKFGPRVGFREHHLAQVHAFYERWGAPTVFWCRFLPFVRGVAALPPGLSRMPKRFFLTYTALGSAIFCFGLAYVGNVAGRNLDAILGAVHKVGFLALGIALVLAIAGFLWWRSHRARTIAEAQQRPL